MTVYRATAAGRFTGPALDLPCALGAGGVIAADRKEEGDGASPIGIWPVRRAFWRPERLAKPPTSLVLDPIEDADGWCDDPADPAYNRPVRRPYPARHEAMARADGLYDLVVVLGHNDDPPAPGRGSAIFLHCAAPDLAPTRGCVAIERSALSAVLRDLEIGDAIEIAP